MLSVWSYKKFCHLVKTTLFQTTSFQPFPKQDLVFMCLQYKSFENTVGKGEISRSVFYLSGEHSAIFIKFEIVVGKLFQFEGV